MLLSSLLVALFATISHATDDAIPVLSLQAQAPMAIQNGLEEVPFDVPVGGVTSEPAFDRGSTSSGAASGSGSSSSGGSNRVVVDLPIDGGWFKFYFGQAGDPTAYIFRIQSDDYVQISITDAYCPGDDWDVNVDKKYLFTTPRVPSRNCVAWTDNPDVAFYNPIWSSTKFMLPGSFNLTLWTKDSPYKGGAAFIRADSRIVTCSNAVGPFYLITTPLVPYAERASLCRRIGAVPAHVTPNNALFASQSMTNCLGADSKLWFGRLSIVQMSALKSLEKKNLGCLALSNAVPEDPTVTVVDCEAHLPVLCTLPTSEGA